MYVEVARVILWQPVIKVKLMAVYNGITLRYGTVRGCRFSNICPVTFRWMGFSKRLSEGFKQTAGKCQTVTVLLVLATVLP